MKDAAHRALGAGGTAARGCGGIPTEPVSSSRPAQAPSRWDLHVPPVTWGTDPHHLRRRRTDIHDGHVCTGEARLCLHPCLCPGLCPVQRLRIPVGGVALRSCRSDLDSRRHSSLREHDPNGPELRLVRRTPSATPACGTGGLHHHLHPHPKHLRMAACAAGCNSDACAGSGLVINFPEL